MTDETYNGWTNYPTWCVNLWLANDRGLYEETIERTRAVIADEHPTSTVWTVEESRRFNVADAIESWVEDLTDDDSDDGAGLTVDLLGWALGHVNWHEIADAWIEVSGEDDR